MKLQYTFCLTLVCILNCSYLQCQIADINSGCVPLKVQFSSNSLNSYFWEFGDGITSEFQNPEHIYTETGNYTVSLFQGEGGSLVGQLVITVFDEIQINIDAEIKSGCAPFAVSFTSDIIAHPDIDIEEVLWTFGEGGSSVSANPTYTYDVGGIFDVSVKVTTKDGSCDQLIIFDEFIYVEKPNIAFTLSNYLSCTTPATINITNLSEFDDANDYAWDFGNGQTFSGFDPPSQVYDELGIYDITLTATTPLGCVNSLSRNLRVGSPIIDLVIHDFYCIDTDFQIENNTIANNFLWQGEESGNYTIVGEDTANPIITFFETGNYVFNVSAFTSQNCISDTTIVFQVGELNSNFVLGPDITCGEFFDITLEAEETNYAQYEWINQLGESIISIAPDTILTYNAPVRDEFYVNQPDSLPYALVIKTESGCTDTTKQKLRVQKPEAFFIPDTIIGFGPLHVTFTDFSYADELIVNRIWDFGNGTDTIGSEFDTIVHSTYTQPGIYFVNLIVETEEGCRDRSENVLIQVLPPIDSINVNSIPISGLPVIICTGDSVNVSFPPISQGLDLKIITDNGRFDHCWKKNTADYVFQFPGVYPVIAALEFNGFLITEREIGEITVIGTYVDANHFIDCSDKYTARFEANTINTTEISWTFDDQLISQDSIFEYTFPDTGDYMVYVEVFNPAVPCPPRIDSTLVRIRDMEAAFTIPDKVCAYTDVLITSSSSESDGCSSFNRWEFEGTRPRSISTNTIIQQFEPGRQEITLIASDVNGCTSSASKSITAYGIESLYEIDDRFCIPIEIDFEDLSTADTTIVDWDWNFGANTPDPSYTFTEEDVSGDSVLVSLAIEDALGCRDTFTTEASIYRLDFVAVIPNGVCIGNDISLGATDFTEEGSYLLYEWNFSPYGASSEQSASFTPDEAGSVLVQLTAEEFGTGCIVEISEEVLVVPEPIADFTSNVDLDDFICHPESIEFINTSQTTGPIVYSWNFSNGSSSILENPVITFEKGTWDAELTANSAFGCEDTVNATFTLVGPEGSIAVDKDTICPGEEFTFELINPIDVSSFSWDLGDGTVINDQSPVTYSYGNIPPDSLTRISLILRSGITGCELIDTIPVQFNNIFSDFDTIAQVGFCTGEIMVENLSQNANSYEWIIQGNTYNEQNPTLEFEATDQVTIELIAKDENSNCQSSTIKTYELETGGLDFTMPNVFTPNGDNRNDHFNIIAPKEDLVETIEFKIYNRWGELIYNNNTPENGWDGTWKGEPQPEEVYSYYINYQNSDCVKGELKGNVTVVR